MDRSGIDPNHHKSILAIDTVTSVPFAVEGISADGSINVNITGGSSSGTQYTEGDTDVSFTGTIAMAEGPSNTATPLQVDASKNLQVDIAADSVGIGGGTQYSVDDVAGATDTGTLALAVRDDALATLTPVDGDYTQLRTNSRGAQWVAHDGDITIADGGNSITIDGTVAVSSVTTSITPGTGATDLGKAEDAAHTSGDVGIAVLTKRTDTAASSAGTDGDYATLNTDNTGRVWVNVGAITASSQPLPTGGATAANQSTIIGHIDGIEGLLGTIDTDTGNIAAGFATEGSALGSGVLLQGDDGTDRKNINVDATTGDVQVDVTNTVTVDGSGVTQPVSGTVTANAGTDLNTSALALETTATSIKTAVEVIDNAISGSEMQVDVVAALPAGTNAIGKLAANNGVDIGDVDVTSVIPGTGATNLGKAIDSAAGATDTGIAPVAIRDDALSTLTPAEGDYAPLRVDANGGLWVSLATALNSTDDVVGVDGTVAHDSADSNNPVKIGAKAETALSGITLVVDGDRTDLYAGVDGVLITRPHTNLEDIVSGNASNTDGSSTSVIAAAGAGIKQYLTSFTITNTSATDTYCELKSGTTVKWTVPVPANGGVTHSFAAPLPPNAANEAWNFDMGAAVTTAYASFVGFKSKV